MKKLVDIVSENNSLSFSSDGKEVDEEKVLPLIKKEIADLNFKMNVPRGFLVCVSADRNSANYKKSLEVLYVQQDSSILFSFYGRIPDKCVWDFIKEDCSSYARTSNKYSLDYISNSEYEDFKKQGEID